jgi:hypothetical protein
MFHTHTKQQDEIIALTSPLPNLITENKTKTNDSQDTVLSLSVKSLAGWQDG